MEREDACASARREIIGVHAEVSRISVKLEELAAKSGGSEELIPEIRRLDAAVEGLDRSISELGRQLPAPSRSLGEEIPWYEWI